MAVNQYRPMTQHYTELEDLYGAHNYHALDVVIDRAHLRHEPSLLQPIRRWRRVEIKHFQEIAVTQSKTLPFGHPVKTK